MGEVDDEPPKTTSSPVSQGLALEEEEENDVVGDKDAVEENEALTLESAPVVCPPAVAEEGPAAAVVPDPQEPEPRRQPQQQVSGDEAEAERMMAETNALVFECDYVPCLISPGCFTIFELGYSS